MIRKKSAYEPETILADDPNYGHMGQISTDKAMRLSYRQLIDLSIALEESNVVGVHTVHGVGKQTWNGYVCVAWNRDERGNYHYLCIGGK